MKCISSCELRQARTRTRESTACTSTEYLTAGQEEGWDGLGGVGDSGGVILAIVIWAECVGAAWRHCEGLRGNVRAVFLALHLARGLQGRTASLDRSRRSCNEPVNASAVLEICLLMHLQSTKYSQSMNPTPALHPYDTHPWLSRAAAAGREGGDGGRGGAGRECLRC
eukprot:834171-Rhodomonas_salina.1